MPNERCQTFKVSIQRRSPECEVTSNADESSWPVGRTGLLEGVVSGLVATALSCCTNNNAKQCIVAISLHARSLWAAYKALKNKGKHASIIRVQHAYLQMQRLAVLPPYSPENHALAEVCCAHPGAFCNAKDWDACACKRAHEKFSVGKY